MRNKLLFYVFLVLSIFTAQESKASHIIGGEIYYDSLGNNTYKITFEIYRDCNSFTDYDNPLQYTIFNANGSIFDTISVYIFSRNILPIIYDDPCVTPPNDICVERAIYIDTVTLPFNPNGYYITYQRCCWTSVIDNIVDPANNGITLTTSIPGSSLVPVHNQGARFNNYPPLVLCSNNTLNFDHSATDPDGDSLVYSLVDPLLGGSSVNVVPDPETTAPYTPVSWNPTFSTTQPFGSGSTVTINPNTGMMSFTPNLIGSYVAGVEVKEYRNGILINSKIRTFGYRVVGCQVQLPIEVDITGPSQLIEDCGFAGFIVTRDDTTTNLTLQVLLSGTAVNGEDYPFINDTLIIPTGVFSDTIGISAFYDSITEGTETVFFNIIIPDPCDGTFDTTSISLNIVDYIPMTIESLDSVNVCAEIGEGANLWCSVENGVPSYSYDWEPGAFPNNDTVYAAPTILEPNQNVFFVTASDQCGKAITSLPIFVYNQCPLIVPNVMTINGDNVNDALIITNWEDYDKVSLTIMNRWGNIVYENSDYKNDWKGLDKSGAQLSEGVYFYTVTPTSIKYEYDDVKKTLYTLHGFIHIFNK
ncbi:MAG: gliding motility-associated C-terminal domain-containing protein [Fluviicola sp.]|nr:gliding motility-associated C-terminal domain-containing protein [Fluviicola sp.]